jgi:hypothetical protein
MWQKQLANFDMASLRVIWFRWRENWEIIADNLSKDG